MDLSPLLSGDSRLIEEIERATLRALNFGFSGNALARSHREDICQEVLAAALRQAGRIEAGEAEPIRNLNGWVIRVTRNAVHKTWHRQGGDDAPIALEAAPEVEAPRSSPESLVNVMAVRQAWRKLDGYCRNLLFQDQYLGKTGQELAEDQGKSPGAVRVALSRCRKKLLRIFFDGDVAMPSGG